MLVEITWEDGSVSLCDGCTTNRDLVRWLEDLKQE